MTAYLDERGTPQLRQSIVGFLDILGFSQVATADERIEDSQRVLEKIAHAIEDSRRFVRAELSERILAERPPWEVKFFSDNLVLGYPLEETQTELAAQIGMVIRCAQRYQLQMALNGFFLRGALSHGPVCMTDEIIFGSALIECYQLESKASIVPRVLVAEKLQGMFAQAWQADKARLPATVGESICKDVDGKWFVNYLQAACRGDEVDWEIIEQHKQSVLKSLASTNRHEVLPKFGWACRYHNVFCHWHHNAPGYSDRYRIDRTDEQSTINRLFELPAVQ